MNKEYYRQSDKLFKRLSFATRLHIELARIYKALYNIINKFDDEYEATRDWLARKNREHCQMGELLLEQSALLCTNNIRKFIEDN